MRQLQKVGIYFAAVILLASCTEHNPTNFNMEKPQSIALQDSLDNNYNPLKTYVDSVNSSFSLGAGVSISAYSEQGIMYRLVNSNFHEVTLKDMGHGAIVQGNGSLALESMNSSLAAAQRAGVSVYGNGLVSHSENESRLNRLIAPDTIQTSGPAWVVISEADFETDDASNYTSNAGAATSFTAEGEGAYGEGRALQIVNEEVRANPWDSQFFFTFGPHAEAGDQFRFTMDVRAETETSFATQGHNEPYQYIQHGTFGGSVPAPTEWFTYTTEVTIGEGGAGIGTIAFNLGNTATTYYFDNMKIEYYDEEGGVVTEEKTEEEKEQIITTELENYVSTMIDTAAIIDTWEVVSEPIAETNPMAGQNGNNFNLKSSGDFDWHQHMGADYGVSAFQSARANGDDDDVLFISDYDLEANLDKCRALINYVEYIESNGATVDGISTQMHITVDTDRQNITQMFELLEATGKMIKVSELEVGLGSGVTAETATEADYEQQAEMYQFVVEEYFSAVPEDQRYGITVWSPLNTAVGLWSTDYNRTRAYGGFATGLQNVFGSDN